MRVLADLHHYDLYHSLQILFEKRLGWELYRPIGLDWYHEKFWAVYPHINTAHQYLSIDAGKVPLDIRGDPIDQLHGTDPWLNRFTSETSPGIYEVRYTSHVDRMDHMGVTLEAFKATEFDIVIASMPGHIAPFRKLIQQYQPKAKFIFQAGNNWRGVDAENLMTSAKGCSSKRPGANRVFYHQEFDLDVYKPGPCVNPRSIMNLQHFSSSIGKLREVERYLNGWDVKIHGGGGNDQPVPGIELPQRIRDTGFVWHVKREDEGYGYNIHTSYASGTPLVVGCSYQKNFTAGLLYDNNTVIDANTNTPQQIADKLIAAADDYDAWSTRVYDKFKSVVDFDAEFEEIKKFLDRLI
jgi:hypothetical protein